MEAEDRGSDAPGLEVGFTFELCAGLIDKEGKSLEQIASEEVREECGFEVPPSAMRKVTSYVSAIGISGATQHIFFAEVDEGMRVPAGGSGPRTMHRAQSRKLETLGLGNFVYLDLYSGSTH